MDGTRYIRIENLSAGVAIVWGLFVINPYVDLFDRYPQIYKPMAQLAPEWIWGLAFVASGVVAFRCAGWGTRRRALMLMTIVYSFFACLFFLGDKTSPGWGVYGLFALFNAMGFRAERWNTRR